MRRVSIPSAWVIGALTSLPAIALLYGGMVAFDLPFGPFDAFEAVTRWLPGAVVTAGIDLIVGLLTALGIGPLAVAAKAAEQTLAVGLAVALAGVIGGFASRLSRPAAAMLPALAVLVAVSACELLLGRASVAATMWNLVVLAGWGLSLAWSLDRARASHGVEVAGGAPADARAVGAAGAPGRRHFLGRLAGGCVAAAGAVAGLVAASRRGRPPDYGGPETSNARLTSAERVPAPPEAAVAGRLAPVRGTRPELTSNDRFYRIDINLEPPRIEAAAWRLEIDGLVTAPAALALAELRALPRTEELITLECISNPLGGDLISTSRWAGVRLRDLLARVKPNARARTIQIEAADGFYESLSLAEADDPRVMLVYEMNGEPLLAAHGFPLRIYRPNRYGMKQPKWIRRLRLTDTDGRGYWVERGWSKEAFVKTTSVIDNVGSSMMIGEARAVGIGGVAYAGARGISKVEVQVDGGPWTEAKLVLPPLSALCWVLWRYDWPYIAGRHTFRVRAYDATGALQPIADHGPRPDGSSGIQSRTMTL